MNNDRDKAFRAIEATLAAATKRAFGESARIVVRINRQTGDITATRNDEPFDLAQTLEPVHTQAIFQKIRETVRDALFDEYHPKIGQEISGVVQRHEDGATTVLIGPGIEAIVPRSEQRPGMRFEPDEPIRAILIDVKKACSRIKIILSSQRTPDADP